MRRAMAEGEAPDDAELLDQLSDGEGEEVRLHCMESQRQTRSSSSS